MSTISSVPTTLRVVGGVVIAQALAVVATGGWIAIGTLREQSTAADRSLGMGLGTGGFLVAAGIGLFLAGGCLFTARGWVRGPVVLAELLMLPLGWELLAEPTTTGGMALILSAIVVLIGVFLPSSNRVINAGRDAAHRTDSQPTF